MALSRRTLLLAAAATPLASPAFAQTIATSSNEARYAASPFRQLTEAQWRERLSPDAFRVLHREGTEAAGTSPLDDEHRRGLFHCAGCDLPLFRSQWKFNSHTGWPSFFRVMLDNVGTTEDDALGYARTEYHCARCLGHQGHVFPDGPRPTGLRYCNNGVALIFRPA